ncbi:hypothetical protein PILCRDRAFT_4745 [Piloderma croceum F 1598]|uniref:Uncharacterized protein n=1 Tax=Piloderma croceum (strain F 1598) TaxID=765440 RepID=A0A0C3C947_PILCF|nr:hypothetical protein PILCRDRAFT_4745 [Piloderma croceum F 1598]
MTIAPCGLYRSPSTRIRHPPLDLWREVTASRWAQDRGHGSLRAAGHSSETCEVHPSILSNQTMGAKGLWPLLEPAGIPISLRQFAIDKGFTENVRGDHTLHISVDVSRGSDWICVAKARHGPTHGRMQNLELTSLLLRYEKLARIPLTIHFVFDRPEHPSVKRGIHGLTIGQPTHSKP